MRSLSDGLHIQKREVVSHGETFASVFAITVFSVLSVFIMAWHWAVRTDEAQNGGGFNCDWELEKDALAVVL